MFVAGTDLKGSLPLYPRGKLRRTRLYASGRCRKLGWHLHRIRRRGRQEVRGGWPCWVSSLSSAVKTVWLSAASVGGHFLSANLMQPHRGAWKQPPSSSTQRSAALTGRWSAVLLSGTDRETRCSRLKEGAHKETHIFVKEYKVLNIWVLYIVIRQTDGPNQTHPDDLQQGLDGRNQEADDPKHNRSTS